MLKQDHSLLDQPLNLVVFLVRSVAHEFEQSHLDARRDNAACEHFGQTGLLVVLRSGGDAVCKKVDLEIQIQKVVSSLIYTDMSLEPAQNDLRDPGSG